MFLLFQYVFQLLVQALNHVVELLAHFINFLPLIKNLVVSYNLFFVVRDLAMQTSDVSTFSWESVN